MTSLDVIILVLMITWIVGMFYSIAGILIHLLLLIAIVVLIFKLIGRSKK